MADIRTHYLDASAIVKYFVDEDGSQVLREYVNKHPVFSTTSVCFAETLGAFKIKYLRKELSQENYFAACEELMGHIRERSLQIDDIGISKRDVFNEVEDLAKKYDLDVSDSFQLVTLRRGAFSRYTGDSKPILITADKKLARAANAEGFRVWDCLRDAAL
ncbi:hypothetical protein GCM10027046_26870 [Uliginosibacterium flavum]|uniref:Type II toxin-antitoxin system VapC family toxin n=1 Tax=Uliginosibacterium flavum TaxID=1396831 RepID=A0ABV2TJU5_9RHOO